MRGTPTFIVSRNHIRRFTMTYRISTPSLPPTAAFVTAEADWPFLATISSVSPHPIAQRGENKKTRTRPPADPLEDFRLRCSPANPLEPDGRPRATLHGQQNEPKKRTNSVSESGVLPVVPSTANDYSLATDHSLTHTQVPRFCGCEARRGCRLLHQRSYIESWYP